MLHCKILCCSTLLVLTVFGARRAEASAGELASPASSLSEELQRHVNAIERLPRDEYGRLADSQELIDKLEATLNLIVDRLPDFLKDYEACNRMSKLSKGFFTLVPYNRQSVVKDYAHLGKDVRFQCRLGKEYCKALEIISEILKLWGASNLGSLDALGRLLRAGIEALPIDCKVNMYSEGIWENNPKLLLQYSQENFAVEADGQGAGKVEQTICAKYGTLTKRAAGLFGQMLSELEHILNDLEDPRRAEAYQLFQGYLDHCFRAHNLLPVEIKENEEAFRAGDQMMPSEMQASMRVQIFGELLEFKLKFPELDHETNFWSALFFESSDYEESLNDGSHPTIGKVIMPLRELISAPSGPEVDWVRLSLLCNYQLSKLGRWVRTLYQGLSDDQSVSHEQAEKWLSDIEKNLCTALGAIEAADRRLGLHALGCLINHLESMAVMIEGALRTLYKEVLLRRREGEPGHFLIKLRQVIAEVISSNGITRVKSALMTQGPETF